MEPCPKLLQSILLLASFFPSGSVLHKLFSLFIAPRTINPVVAAPTVICTVPQQSINHQENSLQTDPQSTEVNNK